MIKLESLTNSAFFLCVVAAVIALAFTVAGHLSLPTVQVSNSTGECVRVLPEGSCDNLPPKYVREWVK